MAQPTPYVRQNDFSDDEASAVGGRSTVRTAAVDAELDALGLTANQTRVNLGLIQRDDGKLRDGATELHTLAANVRGLLTAGNVKESNLRGDWATATAYVPLDIVSEGGRVYICALAHTAGVFATDEAAGRWMVLSADPVSALAALASTDINQGSSLVGYRPAGGGISLTRTVQDKLRESVSVKDFGAVGDGVADDTAAIQAALNLGGPVVLPNGRYRTTAELVWSDGSVLIGPQVGVFTQFAANTPPLGHVAEIFYDGPAGENSCVCRMSKAAVGTKPVFQSNESQTLRFAGIIGVYINGNNKAEFGLYSARAGTGCVYRDVGITGTKKHGAWFGEMFLGFIRNIVAAHNYGCGITIGQDTFAWSGGNNVNGVSIDTLVAFRNGRDLSAWTTSTYQEGYGVGLYLGRTCNVRMVDAEWNEGVGVLIQPSSGPASIVEVYTENNCWQFPTSAERFQIWFQSGANGFGQVVDGVYMLFNASTPSGVTNAPRLRITGTPPTPFTANDSPTFKRVSIRCVIDATIGEYRLEDLVAASLSFFSAHYPQYSDPESISTSQTTLYVDDVATGNGSGVDTSNYITFDAAMRVARVLSSVTTINTAAMTGTPSAGRVVDGRGFTRPLTIDGGTTGRLVFATDNTAATFKNWGVPLTVQNMLSVDRCYVNDSRVVFRDDPTIRTGANSGADAALVVSNSNVEIAGTSVLDVSTSTAATKISLAVAGGSKVTLSNAVAGTIASVTTGNAIHFNGGGGLVMVSNSTATATWAAAANVTRNTGGGAGVILATNGINP